MADVRHQLAQCGDVAGILSLLHQCTQLIAQDAAEILVADEGGEGAGVGQHAHGAGQQTRLHQLVQLFTRKYKKDSFYAYKAWLNPEPMVHLCGKRYIDRVEDVTKVTVYSNQPAVELFANGVSLGVKEAADHFFYFDVPNAGETKLEAVAGDLRDESVIRKVETFNEAYRMKEVGAILNWFDIEEREGYFSLNSKMSDIMSTLRGKLWLAGMMMTMKKKMDANKKPEKSGEKKEKKGGFDIDLKSIKGMGQMLGGFTVLRLTSMMGMANISFTKEELLAMHAKLSKIKCPKK